MAFTTEPPAVPPELLIGFPIPHVLLLTLNRPKQLNAMTPALQAAIERVLDWFEDEVSLWVVIVTGKGRAFCAGQDLKMWLADRRSAPLPSGSSKHGFASISRRKSCKPIIAAVNGVAMGGGMELIVNCDLVVASEDAKFALPEVSRGVVAAQGGIPRIAAISGHQLASEMLLLGQPISAQLAHDRFGFVNRVVPASEVLPTALKLAQTIVNNSPDSVWSTKIGLVEGRGDVEGYVQRWEDNPRGRGFAQSENIAEGLRAFQEKRKPAWKNPAPISAIKAKL
ncbi:enoyl-CoA hydratase/carnithine racemase [Calocera cornea HHB12733]|uniref:Enoyl-CoA hydratase/carnithine racemase n=1 Tax=Calocera cornea HHB12733 TaxID=1353952 RepID=A0A165GQR1_9BASI|nr:enoyl-CoA hydratase/carnithine racemase [Calocera cornea HHB12733]